MTLVRDQVIPVLRVMVQWITDNKDIIVTLAGAVVGAVAIFKVVTAATKAWAAMQAILNGESSPQPHRAGRRRYRRSRRCPGHRIPAVGDLPGDRHGRLQGSP